MVKRFVKTIYLAAIALTVLLLWDSPASEPTQNAGKAAVPSSQRFIIAEELASMIQVTERLRETIRNKELSLIHNEDAMIRPAYIGLMSETNRTAISNFDQFRPALARFVGQIVAMHTAADAGDQTSLERQMPEVIKAFEALKALFPQAIREQASALAAKYTCPMHPALVGKRGDSCPKCGMELDQMVRILPAQTGGEQTIHASIRTEGPLQIGKQIKAWLTLSRDSGEPVLIGDLIEVHTEKIHLLIIEPSLVDYHHEHPRPTDIPGQYVFGFTPSKKGPYRAWADLRPYPSGLQEYVIAEIPAEGAAGSLTDKSVTTKSEAGGLHFELIQDQPRIKAGQPAKAHLRISDSTGAPFSKLEPVMATFAHLVGFNEDYQTVLHMHPAGPPVLQPGTKGGPELEFQIYSLKPGFFRLFAQVQVGGVSIFAPFGLQIE